MLVRGHKQFSRWIGGSAGAREGDRGIAVPRSDSVSERISVLHLIHTMAYGGVETSIINWVLGIDRTRFDIHLVCFENAGNTEAPFVEAARRHGVPVVKIPWGRRKPLLKSARALVRLLQEYKVDILHTHNWYADFVGALAAKLSSVRTITTLYVWFDYDWKRNLIQAIDKRVVRSFDMVTAHCEDTRRKTLKFGLPADRVRTLASGFKTNHVDLSKEKRLQRRRAMGIADDDIVLVNVARLYPEKTHDFLLRCFRQIRERCPQAKLRIAGVGPLEKRVKALCVEMGLDSAVTFLGFVEDLPALLSLVDIQIHPALIEGVPLAICAGMAAGLPIVASAVGGLPEILNYGRNGILVPQGNESLFVEAVVKLVEDPEARCLLGTRARQFVENEYSLTNAVKRVEQVYEEVFALCDSESS